MIKDENVRSYIKKELPEVKDVDSLKFGGIVEYAPTLSTIRGPYANSPQRRTERERRFGHPQIRSFDPKRASRALLRSRP
jgi:hypothetical protein